jgi:predicted TIM-barrel fold metal-dependent hydrolase
MIIDTNVYLDRWPFRRLPCDETPRLLEKLVAHGVRQAWVGSFDGVFHKDIGAVNARLAEACDKSRPGMLVPFGSINPMIPDWKEDIRRCCEDYHMPGIRLHPNYHGYKLDDPVFEEVLDQAQRRSLIVQLTVRMEDTRTHHPLFMVPNVDVGPLVELTKNRPTLRIVLLNALQTVRGSLLEQLVGSGNVFFELATLEGIEGISRVLPVVPLDRILFGSHMPLFHLESALLKLRESELTPAQRDAITHQNARQLLRR